MAVVPFPKAKTRMESNSLAFAFLFLLDWDNPMVRFMWNVAFTCLKEKCDTVYLGVFIKQRTENKNDKFYLQTDRISQHQPSSTAIKVYQKN